MRRTTWVRTILTASGALTASMGLILFFRHPLVGGGTDYTHPRLAFVGALALIAVGLLYVLKGTRFWSTPGVIFHDAFHRLAGETSPSPVTESPRD